MEIEKATNFYPAEGILEADFIRSAALSSLADETPEGKSILELAALKPENLIIENPSFIEFTAETRSSGVDFEDIKIRKGAYDSIKQMTERAGNAFPPETKEAVEKISNNGGTPLVVLENDKVIGVIELHVFLSLITIFILSSSY